MNLILLDERDFQSPDLATLGGRRYRHLTQILKVKPGQLLKVGKVNGRMGAGEVIAVRSAHQTVTLRVVLDTDPPPPSRVTLILAMPRPLVFRRAIQHAVTMGTEQIFVIGSRRVEKSYFHTPLLQAASIERIVHEALEQAVDTRVPQVLICPHFLEFFRDNDSLLCSERKKFLAHPGSAFSPPFKKEGQGEGGVLLAIGPEGGFVDSEVADFKSHGFELMGLGPRILRVETAVCVALAKLAKLACLSK